MPHTRTQKTAPATWTDTITSRDLRVASVSLLTRGEMPSEITAVLPQELLTDTRLAKRFLAYTGDSILAQSLLWQDRNVDAEQIAEKLRRVPAKAACATYERLYRTSVAIWEKLVEHASGEERDARLAAARM